ncbi:DUF2947 family protein [Hymenobacter chitinivorans]|uniref:Uncharacterized protein n=1 Tax=Hymenobacter chitinivorans DSM 11115 TaxID=1121954 RepID=A0A2M9BLA4_9BACT|nr:DUF2947 family protein [Hymenobacter chitinivorans]PJJ58737.1 Protein of unknown function (DUF2947) [Hymenobacter chitinivorans DSM 11115]
MSIVPVCHSVFAEAFRGIDSKGIFLLDKEDAFEIWKTHIDDEANSYFQLSDKNWLVSSKPKVIGDWLQAFNDSNNTGFEEVSDCSTTWSETDTIFFCISKHFVIQSTWQSFKKHWRYFIECDDDCPIVINSVNQNCAILFYPIGIAVMVEIA